MQNLSKILLSMLIVVLCGIALGYFYSQLPENNPQRDQKSCESINGEWSKEKNMCLLSYKEAGEPCTDGGQCKSGVCSPPELTEEQKINLSNGPLKNITGTCYPENLIKACVAQVLLGTISMGSMCLLE